MTETQTESTPDATSKPTPNGTQPTEVEVASALETALATFKASHNLAKALKPVYCLAGGDRLEHRLRDMLCRRTLKEAREEFTKSGDVQKALRAFDPPPPEESSPTDGLPEVEVASALEKALAKYRRTHKLGPSIEGLVEMIPEAERHEAGVYLAGADRNLYLAGILAALNLDPDFAPPKDEIAAIRWLSTKALTRIVGPSPFASPTV